MNRVFGKVQSFRRMIAQLAWRTWKTMPRQHQIWIDIDDLIEDGMFEAYRIVKSNWQDPSKGALSTVIYHVVKNHLHNEYIVRYGNEMRFATLESAGIVKKKRKGLTPANLVSIDADKIGEPPQLSTSEETIYSNVLTDCFVIPVIGKIYQEASTRLQEEIVTWFLCNKEKIHTKGRRFRIAAKEFRGLAEEYDLTYFDCQHLFTSSKCMDLLSRELLWIPHSLDNPAPAADRQL